MGNEHILLITTSLVVTALIITSTVSNNWVNRDIEKPVNYTSLLIHHYGIWEACFFDGVCKSVKYIYFEYQDGLTFNTINTIPKWLFAVRTFVILASLLALVACGNTIVSLHGQNAKLSNSKKSLFMAAFTIMVAMSIFTAKEISKINAIDTLVWGWGYIIGWAVTCIIPVVTIIISIAFFGDDK